MIICFIAYSRRDTMSQTQVVIFQVNQKELAIHIDRVERIIGYNSITSLPETSEYVLGLINYQDSIIPVIDLNKRLFRETQEYDENNKILVIQLEEYKVGLLVGEVNEIQSIDDGMIEKPSGIIQGVSPKYIKGLIKKEDNIILFLDVKTIFEGQQKKELINIAQDS